VKLRRLCGAALIVGLGAPGAWAWPTTLMESIARDARRLLPRSLAQLLAEREREVLEEAARFPPELSQPLTADLLAGRLQPATLLAFDARMQATVKLFHDKKVSAGVLSLGALLRIPGDLADPVLSIGAQGFPPGVVTEYYAFVAENLEKIPVVLDDPPALKLERRSLGPYWQGVLDRSRFQAPVIMTEMFQRGRVVSRRGIDYRSPVFGVGSLSYSRAVTAVAATWLAVWREARGDISRRPEPQVVAPAARPEGE
jgi:hypothetical protein